MYSDTEGVRRFASMSGALEVPSGKGAGDENFPVGLWFFPHYRTIRIFYRFARAIDDIADSPELSAEDKVERLSRFERALIDGEGDRDLCAKAYALRASCNQTGVSLRYGADLIIAFKRDAIKSRYQTWDEVLEYCRYSANPVGRFLLDLYQESKEAYPASDALCSALQVLNHLQDCGADYRLLNRVYLPLEWIEGHRLEDLGVPRRNLGLSRAIEGCLDRVACLLEQAEVLPRRLKSVPLYLKSRITLSLGRRLLARLRRRDPIEHDVRLSRGDFVMSSLFLR